MSLSFEPISLERQRPYLNRLSLCPQISSDYSFVNLWAWADTYGILWAWSENLVWLKQTRPQLRYWAPIGSWDKIDWEKELPQALEVGDVFVRIPETLQQYWQDRNSIRFETTEDRGQWDYLYLADQLKQLKGNQFHKKKNLLNQFKKKYTYRFEPFTEELIPQAIKMQNDWCQWRDCESFEMLGAENVAIEVIFHHWNRLMGLTGGALIVGQTIAAYTVAEKLTDDMVLIHFEKADPAFKGGYQAINQIFLEQFPEPFRLVNREQDLDDEGLRRAKLSYHPVDFIRKYKLNVV